MKISRFQKIASYLFPLRVWKGSGANHTALELFISRGRWQLTTSDAIYSDGIRYRPLVLAFRSLRHRLPAINRVLVLSSGIGSAVQIFEHLGFRPQFTLVDHDEVILRLAEEILGRDERIKTVCCDAASFVENNQERFDLVVIDIFESREVPAFVSSEAFIRQCRQRLSAGGSIVVNFMINNERDRQRFQGLRQNLPEAAVIDIGLNKVLVFTDGPTGS